VISVPYHLTVEDKNGHERKNGKAA